MDALLKEEQANQFAAVSFLHFLEIQCFCNKYDSPYNLITSHTALGNLGHQGPWPLWGPWEQTSSLVLSTMQHPLWTREQFHVAGEVTVVITVPSTGWPLNSQNTAFRLQIRPWAAMETKPKLQRQLYSLSYHTVPSDTKFGMPTKIAR